MDMIAVLVALPKNGPAWGLGVKIYFGWKTSLTCRVTGSNSLRVKFFSYPTHAFGAIYFAGTLTPTW